MRWIVLAIGILVAGLMGLGQPVSENATSNNGSVSWPVSPEVTSHIICNCGFSLVYCECWSGLFLCCIYECCHWWGMGCLCYYVRDCWPGCDWPIYPMTNEIDMR